MSVVNFCGKEITYSDDSETHDRQLICVLAENSTTYDENKTRKIQVIEKKDTCFKIEQHFLNEFDLIKTILGTKVI
jgi:hypothetical protein